ncbi:MAG: hypothetical protein GKR93_16800 [Gammaproteobacteria bacterium]|nr:hypothetical protein [Gammaproteobacteria bacterium]
MKRINLISIRPVFTKSLLVTLLLPLLLTFSFRVHSQNFDNADDYYEDALLLYKKKDFSTAIIQLKNALQLNEKHLPAKILLGEAYLGSGEAQAA